MGDNLRISTISTDWKSIYVAGVQATIPDPTIHSPTLLLPHPARLRSAVKVQVYEMPG